MSHVSSEARKPFSAPLEPLRMRSVTRLFVALAFGAAGCDGRTNEEAARRSGDSPVPVGTNQSANARAIRGMGNDATGAATQTGGTTGSGITMGSGGTTGSGVTMGSGGTAGGGTAGGGTAGGGTAASRDSGR
jgi:hypothetical protein